MSASTDRTLAYIVYAKNDIPLRDWKKHYALDSRNGMLTIKARRAYTRIWRSIAAAV